MADRSLRIALVYNTPVLAPEDADRASETGVLESVVALKGALLGAGHTAIEVPAAHSIRSLIETLLELQPDVIVNLCESWRGQSAHEAHIASLFELLELPYTGSPPECLALVRDKARTQRLLSAAGIATALFMEIPVSQPPPENPLRDWLAEGPVFVKPASEDASLGISFASVTTNWEVLAEQVSRVHIKYGAALAERYIDGREFNVGILELPELAVLPVAEIEFQISRDAQWPILTYASKWSPGSTADLAAPVRCPASVDPQLAESIKEASLAAYRATGCRDYARVDVRVDSRGQIYVLEVNANPDIGPTAGFARMLQAQQVSYAMFAECLVENATRRKLAESSVPLPTTFDSNLPSATTGRTPSNEETVIRELTADDVPRLLEFTRSCGFFRADEVEVAAEILAEALRDGPGGHYQVLVADRGGCPVGWSCHGRVPLTDATFDLYWIVVAPTIHRTGVGRKLLIAVEEKLRAQSARWLLAETSSADLYQSTRQFYLRCGFSQLSQIDDFYRRGDGRLIFGKRIDRT